MRLALIAAGLALAVGIGAYALSRPSPDDLFYADCVAALKERLKSPSSYKLLDRTPVRVETLTLEKAMRWESPEDEAKYRAGGGNQERMSDSARRIRMTENMVERGEAVRSSIFIKYEASNAYGAFIADTALCETDSFDFDYVYRKYDSSSVLVNGKTNARWRVDRSQ